MYPEGCLVAPDEAILIFFEKDPMNPIYEGYIGFWSVTGNSTKQFRYRKRTSKAKALVQWNHLVNQGWRAIEKTIQAA